jgi:superfamily II DNA or RNA helicase
MVPGGRRPARLGATEVTRRMAALDDGARRLVWALSVAFHPLGGARLIEVLARAELPPADQAQLFAALEAGLVRETHQGFECCPEARELASQQALEAGAFAALARAVQGLAPGPPLSPRGATPHLPWELARLRAARDLRVALLSHDRAALAQRSPAYGDLLEWLHAHTEDWDVPVSFASLIPPDYQAKWVLRDLVRGVYAWRLSAETRRIAQRLPGDEHELQRGLALDALLRGEQPALGPRSDPYWAALHATRLLMRGKASSARALFDGALKGLRREIGRRNVDLPGVPGLFHALALAVGGDEESAAQLRALVKRSQGDWRFGRSLDRLTELTQLEDSALSVDEDVELEHELLDDAEPWAQWLSTIALFWRHGPALREQLAPAVADLAARAEATGWSWMARQCLRQRALLRGEAVGEPGVVDLLRFKERWEIVLEGLEKLGAAAQAGAGDEGGAERLTWRVEVRRSQIFVTPYLQKRRGRGWTAGRQLPPQQLRGGAPPAWVLPHDEALVRHHAQFGGWTSHGAGAGWTHEAALVAALVGHPLLFDAHDPAQRIEVVKGAVQLRVERDRDLVRLSCEPWCPTDLRIAALRQGAARIVVYELDERLRSLAYMVGEEGLTVPASAADRVARVSAGLLPLVSVHSELALASAARRVAADARVHLQLRRRGDHMRVDGRVRPLGKEGPWLAPGVGGARVLARIDDVELETERDLAAEQASLARLIERCPDLAPLERVDEPCWVETLEAMLEVMLALAELGDVVAVEWHEGAPLKLRGGGPQQHLLVKVTTADEWLAARGALVVDDERVASLAELVAAPRIGRFVRLGEDDFVALSEALLRELGSLEAFALPGDGDELRLHPVAVHLLEPLGELGALELDDEVAARVARVREALGETAPVPRTLQAELRSYQLEGFRWLARSVDWGAGVCLADDMGLGKTIQLLALLLRRAERGPALVVAPLSVCSAWRGEARRFAPTLRVVTLAEADDRAAVARELGPGDVLVVSYGLLVREVELLAALDFDTVVLDEAQAIKNAVAKRARAAHRLKAAARVAATGTPLENRLSELWSLFHFLDRGLLGTLAEFGNLYARPIERHDDRRALERLRRKIRPFILRRTKSEVLDELPPRTEVVQRIEAPPDEAALYEALRRTMVIALEEARKKQSRDEDMRFAILAALMKLRRACCHPSLVAPEAGLAGAKLRAFVALVRDLVDAGHRVLAFSQFVDVLSLAREALAAAELSCQYLDGSTPEKQRAERVRAFQRGEGDAFLISTKAGGQGITLTAADYVVHLDPWWNPAVEDQASDRAHRIGQTRPVTVIRLVMANSIEESILELHARKRDLADKLLEGAETAAQLGVDELMALLQGP